MAGNGFEALDLKRKELKKQHGDRLVIIDFTHPSAVNPNAELYAQARALDTS